MANMMPRTLNGLDSYECISALQKCIRRGLEREAMHFALEMCMANRSYFTRVLNRLVIIAHEDIGLGDPDAVTFALVSIASIRDAYDAERPGKYGLALGNAIRALCRARKSREGDWFLIACVHAARQGPPVVPDWALDKHTVRGTQMGRGVDHFVEEGCKLVPAPEQPEPYEAEAIAIMRQGLPEVTPKATATDGVAAKHARRTTRGRKAGGEPPRLL